MGVANIILGEVDKSQNASNTCQTDMIDSASPGVTNLMHQRTVHIQHLKANCKPEELQKLRTKCEILVRDCIAGLLVNLSLKDFKEIEGRSGESLLGRRQI